MEITKESEGKKVFLITKSRTQCNGIVIKVEKEIDKDSGAILTWIHLTDKLGKKVSFLSSEIVEWVEK